MPDEHGNLLPEERDSLLSALSAVARGLLSPPPQLAVTNLGPIGKFTDPQISTVNSHDLGPETAFAGHDHRGRWHVHPLERYSTVEEALVGHKRWAELVPTLDEITDIGYPEIQHPYTVSLLLTIEEDEDENSED